MLDPFKNHQRDPYPQSFDYHLLAFHRPGNYLVCFFESFYLYYMSKDSQKRCCFLGSAF